MQMFIVISALAAIIMPHSRTASFRSIQQVARSVPKSLSRSRLDSWQQNRRARIGRMTNLIRIALAPGLVAGIFVAIVGLLWFDGPSPIFAQSDTTAPTVSSVAVTSDTGDDEVYLDDDGVYGIGDKIEATVTFSEDVTVTGSPQLELTVGSSAKNAAYKSTTDSKVVFSYTVTVGDSDTDGISIAADKLSLNEGTIKDAADNDADLSHSAVSTQSGHKVDGIRPTITSVYLIGSTSNQDGVHTIDEPLPADVRFSENVYVGGYPGPLLKLNFNGTSKSADFGWASPECVPDGQPITLCVFSPGPFSRHGISLSFEYEIVKEDLDLDGVAIDANSVVLNGGSIRDGAGNDAVLTHSAVAADSDFIVDGVPATITSVAITSDPGSDNSYGVGDTVEVTVTFSESVSVPQWYGSNGIQMPRLELNVGGVAKSAKTHESASITGTALVFRYTVQNGDSDADGIYIGANQHALNRGSIRDANGTCCPGGNNADLSHSAVAESTGHKVVTPAQPSKSSDAILSALTLTSIDFGTFASGTTSYTAQVANSVTETTVSPTANHSGASYVIKFNGVTDSDGVISLAAGSNVIAVEVTAEDGDITKTYTVTVTRAEPSPDDATLSALTLSGIDFGTFASGTASYTAEVESGVTETTVTPTVNHSGATYVTKLDGIEDADGVVPLAAGSNVITIEVTAEDDNTTRTYTVTVTRLVSLQQNSTDATLSALTLSAVDFGTFDSETLQYTAQVANSVSQTTVTPTVNDSGASYVIKLGGVTDADGVVALSVGSNVITVEVTAEDDSTTRTYTVKVTRAAPPSTDATLSALTLSNINFGTFASGSTSYTAQVAYIVSQTTVTPTVSDSGASYVVKLGGMTDPDSTISLAVGRNAITVEVTAEDDSTTRTYTVTVTRAAASTDATLSALTLSGINFGTFASGTTSYTAQAANSVSQTTISPTANHFGASYVIKLSGVTDADGVIGLSVGSNIVTIEATAEDGSTTRTYTITVTRAEPPSTDATLSALTLGGVDFGTFDSTTTSYTAQVANSVSQTTVMPTVNDSGASHVIKLGGVTDADGAVALSVGDNVITVEVTAEDTTTTRTYTVTVTRASPPSTDATLSALTLSGIDFGTFVSGTTSYTAQVINTVSQTTVTPTVNDSGASYVIKLGGVTDADGVVALSVGSNVITIEVTAEDDSTTRTYTVTVTRAEPTTPEQLSNDAALSALTLSGVDSGTFDSTTTSYTAQVANSVSQTTVMPTVNDPEASYVVKLGGVTDADGVVALSVGSNVITIEVTAEDGNTTRTYTVKVTRAAPPSTDATLRSLTLSSINFGTFAPGTTSYTAQVAYSVSQTTITPTVNDSGASYVIKLGSTTDTDGVVALSVGNNVITVEVTAEDDSTTRTYTVTVTRAEPASTDATLRSLTLSDVDFGTFDSTTISYTAQVSNSVTNTTVTPAVSDPGASYVIKVGGVTDADGVIALSVGSNVITVEVTAEDDSTTRTYTVTVTRAEPLEPLQQRMMDAYDANDDGVINKDEAITAVLDYFNGDITKDEAIEVVLLYFS